MDDVEDLDEYLGSDVKYPALLLFGPPGSGKGTQAKLLSLVSGHKHLSSGDIFRGIPPKSHAGKLQEKYLNQGQLVPDSITFSIWKNYVEGLVATNAYNPHDQLLLLDGFPRTLRQAQSLEAQANVLGIIVLDCDNENVLIERMQKRALKEGRADDANREALTKRMQVYRDQTKEVLSFYEEDLIVHINALQSPVEVLRDILVKASHWLTFPSSK